MSYPLDDEPVKKTSKTPFFLVPISKEKKGIFLFFLKKKNAFLFFKKLTYPFNILKESIQLGFFYSYPKTRLKISRTLSPESIDSKGSLRNL